MESSDQTPQAPQNDAALPASPADAPEGTATPAAFHRQPYSFVRRGDRLSPKRQKAWDEHAGEWVLDIPRVMTDTSVDPSYRLDHEAIFGRTAPLVVEIGSGLGEAIVAHLSLIHISEPTRRHHVSRMPSSA